MFNELYRTRLMMRLFDVVLSSVGLILAFPLLLMLLISGWFETGKPIFRQQRVGLDQRSFILIKFRTMHLDTVSVATHLTDASAVTPLGRYLRRTKLDELPQLWNVLRGDMSLVGPRPCLPNQSELIEERARRGVFVVRPGITGLAQIMGIDMSTPVLLAETDAKMLRNLDVKNYFEYIFRTLLGHGGGDRVKGPMGSRRDS